MKAILAALLMMGSFAYAEKIEQSANHNDELAAAFLANSSRVDDNIYYCDLGNVPAVKKALAQGLLSLKTEEMGVTVGEKLQFPINGMGDAFDYWGSDMLVYQLDGLALNNVRSVGVRVAYSSFYALEYAQGEDHPTIYQCVDTGEIMPEKVYIDSKDNPITASTVLF